MGRAQPSAMTGASPPPTQPAAVAAFLRGLERRARLLAQVQAGDPASAARALDVTARVFTADAAQWPLAQWPRQYWRLLLSVPAMRQPGTAPVALLPGIARLAPAPRAAILLHLVAGLDDADAAAALGIAVDAYQARIRDALPRDALGQPDVDVWRAWRAASQRALDALPEAMPVAGTAAPANAKPDAPRLRTIDGHDRHRRRLRWLWLGVALCAAALVATFLLHPRGRALLGEWRNPVHVTPLPPADAPQARFDPGDPALHPDLALLQAPADLRLARELPLLAWLATENATAAQATDTDTSAAAATSTTSATPVVAPTPDASTLAQRLKAWDRLPPQARAAQRGAWAEWQALTDAERTALRAAAARFDALPLDQQRGCATATHSCRSTRTAAGIWARGWAATGQGSSRYLLSSRLTSARRCWNCCAKPRPRISKRWRDWPRPPHRRIAQPCAATSWRRRPRSGRPGCRGGCSARRRPPPAQQRRYMETRPIIAAALTANASSTE